uniref:Uncharacterized protein n=1 Tax=viral metagenome TaxID=1070528 RepID=A0A6C0EAD1_9ZZZZ
MFYTILAKVPVLQNDKSQNKLLKIIVIGSVFYVILHYFLFTKEIELLTKYRQYIYYLIGIDLLTVFSLVAMNSDKKDSDER